MKQGKQAFFTKSLKKPVRGQLDKQIPS
jgi:hypothetical protein